MRCYWVNVYSKDGKITYGGLWPSESEAKNASRSIEPTYRLKIRPKYKMYLPHPYFYDNVLNDY